MSKGQHRDGDSVSRLRVMLPVSAAAEGTGRIVGNMRHWIWPDGWTSLSVSSICIYICTPIEKLSKIVRIPPLNPLFFFFLQTKKGNLTELWVNNALVVSE